MNPISNRPPAAPPAAAKSVAVASVAEAAEASAVPAGWKPSRVAPTAPVASAAPATAAEVATAFYTAFQTKDVAAFEKLYAPEATFKDPIYDLKNRAETLQMWTSLFKAGKDLKLNFKVLESGPDSAKVSWTADYKVFGRPVHNESITDLKVKGGKITQQQDNWSWSKWARQALPLGPLVDFPPVKAAVLFFLHQT